MIKLLLLFSFVLALFASEELGYSNEKKYENRDVYTIQLFSGKNIQAMQEMLQRVPVEFRDKTNLHKSSDYIKGWYSKSHSHSAIKSSLKEIKKAGFEDAYIVKSTSLFMDESLINKELSKEVEKEIKKEVIKEVLKQDFKKSISQFDKSGILLKAQSAYEKGNENEAMIYYEMLLSSNDASEKIKNNLCYLYGKRGAWLQAKEIIESERYQGKLIYAYAYGAVQNTQESYYDDILPYIEVDRSGRLLLLTGYYFEKKEDISKATSFYLMAYEKNRTDLYNSFAYARALDIGQKIEAVALYRDILSKIDNSHPLYAPTQKRVSELRE